MCRQSSRTNDRKTKQSEGCIVEALALMAARRKQGEGCADERRWLLDEGSGKGGEKNVQSNVLHQWPQDKGSGKGSEKNV